MTGAGRGIGRAYALLLGELGAKVVVNDLGGSTLGTGGDAGPADEVVKQIEAAGGAAVANYADVSTVEGGKSVIDTAVEHFGGIDIVVNNAGNMVWGSLPEATIETIDAHYKVHVQGSFNTLHAAWPYFLEKNYGRAILTTSIGMFGLPDNIGYAIAKASMIGMAKSLTVGRKDANININCIAPNAMTRISGRTEEEQAQAAQAAAGDARRWTRSTSRPWSPTWPTSRARSAARPTWPAAAASRACSSGSPTATCSPA